MIIVIHIFLLKEITIIREGADAAARQADERGKGVNLKIVLHSLIA